MKNIIYFLVLLLLSCKNESTILSLKEWNNKTIKIKKSETCPQIASYDINMFINKARDKEIEIINNLIGINNIKAIIEDSFSGVLISNSLRVLDKNDMLHIFKYNPSINAYYYSESSKYYDFNDNIKYKCICGKKYQYVSIRTTIEKGEISNIYVLYY